MGLGGDNFVDGMNDFFNQFNNVKLIGMYGNLMCDMNAQFTKLLESYKSSDTISNTSSEEVAKSFHDIFVRNMLQSAKIASDVIKED